MEFCISGMTVRGFLYQDQQAQPVKVVETLPHTKQHMTMTHLQQPLRFPQEIQQLSLLRPVEVLSSVFYFKSQCDTIKP
jgi:hypothetical protein